MAGVLAVLGVFLLFPGCAGGPLPPPPADVEYAQAMATARASYDRGQVPQAALFYERALRRAEARDDPADLGDAAYNLAVCLIDDNQPARADGLLKTAVAELARAKARTTDVRLVQAKLARQLNDPARATADAEAVTKAADATPAERCQALTLLGQLALDAGRLADVPARARDARAALAAAGVSTAGGVSAAGKPGPVSARTHDGLESAIVGLEARLAERESKPADAAAAYDRQADLARRAGLFADMADALAAAGRAHAAAKADAAAADRSFRAARALLAQGRREPGLAAARAAAEAAGRAGDADLAARAAALGSEADPDPTATQPAATSQAATTRAVTP